MDANKRMAPNEWGWLGSSKWVVRSLRNFDKQITNEFVEAFDHFYKTGNKNKIVKFTDQVLSSYGGRLFNGFLLGEK
ncbi:hypothetical protein [Bacillus sp. CECT 9360]|uniref:hypothetical protein n=1 Tax=Bacillus sp. CECT 9360 TaxID=2845821 RepID=UPI001E3969A4|nr:hypothetical protein [Bacillus sp. CECT 9360]CAH0344421.1 hypothetical protein BCI9360_00676 [Bacillus sp. CECT 9360]